MHQKSPVLSLHPETFSARVDRLMWWIVILGVVLVPTAIAPGALHPFRLPQTLIFRAEGILLLGVSIAASLVLGRPLLPKDRRSPLLLLAGAIITWCVVSTLLSTNRLLSLYSLADAIAGTVIFLTTYRLLQERSHESTAWLLAPALLNAGLYTLQEMRIWNPLTGSLDSHTSNGALLGNPNDVGVFLVGPALASFALGNTSRGRRRAVYWVITVLLVACLILSRTLTAIAAFAVAGTLLTIRRWTGRALLIPLGVVLASALALTTYPSPVTQKLRAIRQHFRSPSMYNQVLTGRMTAWLAAYEIALDHPVTGSGLGTYHWHFFNYKIRVDEKYPTLSDWPEAIGTPINYGEAHNDHLQVLAETGIIGYALFAAALVALAKQSFRRARPDDDPTSSERYASMLALPLALSFAIVAIAQFPLRLAAPMSANLFLAAGCVAWSKRSDGI